MFNFRNLACALAGAALLANAPAALAADYPSRPIRVIVPYAAGGSTDQLARVVAQPMSEALGQPVVIENRPGAGGTIGVDAVVRADPDGYTLLFGNTGPNAVVGLMRKVSYDPLTDLQPISTVANVPMILAVPAGSKAKTLQDFVAEAKSRGSAVNFGSVGVGSLSHLTGEYFNMLAGTSMTHIPYNGGAPMVTAFVTGELDAAFVTGLDGAAFVSSGKVRYLAVGTPEATAVLPGMPAIADSVPGFRSIAWFGVLGPKGMPQEVVDKLQRVVADAVARPETQRIFSERNVEAKSSTPQELTRIIEGEIEQWKPVVRDARIEM
ncbi:tripartite tricarboxylate transporter substrate binding protein [Verticiella sediminum]|uniref:Tripartite tricarboxylate transporter substrate binding protein n=1 Tax=Verticiella sediminum TaxID=1247510 RepID=A0A556AJL3_9BURK|nr:tripartite tricarboxylate transporter substrate binding protein [Verticiella sediminum]TSH93077.1 tripartite tricarboxylate transporter substrate binding protein [Verticiella sediminum]